MNDDKPATRLEIWMKLRWPALVLALVALISFTAMRACHDLATFGRQAATAPVREAGEAAAAIASRFRSGTITTTFLAAVPQLTADQGSKLEVASYEATEIFRREDERRTFFDLLPLGTTVTEIRVPVTYRYHLRLDEPWHLTVRDHSCVVQAPRIRPTLPPAIHTDRLEKHLSSGWLRFDDQQQMEALERVITPLLNARAGNAAHVDLVRDRCRMQVARFVRSWLLVEDHWREDRFSTVVVVFADEDGSEDRTWPPTLSLETADD